MIESKDIVTIGKFQKTHALKGELNAILDVDPSFIEEGNAMIVEIEGIFVPFFAESIREKGKTSYLIKIKGVDDELTAKEFVNQSIYGLKTKIADYLEVDPDELKSDDDLIDYLILNSDGKEIGRVERIDSSTANVLFIINTQDDETVYIPAAEEFIKEIDDEGKRIIMQLPEGLIDLNSKKEDNSKKM